MPWPYILCSLLESRKSQLRVLSPGHDIDICRFELSLHRKGCFFSSFNFLIITMSTFHELYFPVISAILTLRQSNLLTRRRFHSAALCEEFHYQHTSFLLTCQVTKLLSVLFSRDSGDDSKPSSHPPLTTTINHVLHQPCLAACCYVLLHFTSRVMS